MGRKSKKNREVSCEVLVKVSAERESCRSSGEAFRPEVCGGRIQFLRILASGRPADLLPGLPGAALHATDTWIILVLKRGVGQLPHANVLPYALA
jgi:hypothetical protein